MRKSIQKWAYALVTCAFALALCVSFGACSSDDDSKGTDGIVPVLFSEFETYSSFCRMESSLTTDIHWCSQQFKRFRDISTFEIVQ